MFVAEVVQQIVRVACCGYDVSSTIFTDLLFERPFFFFLIYLFIFKADLY